MGDAVRDADKIAPVEITLPVKKPKGYKPLRDNQSVRELPPDLLALAEPPPTATDIPVYQPYKSTTELPAEEGTAKAKEISQTREKSTAIKERTYKAKEAIDVSVRDDPVSALFKSVKENARIAQATPDAKGSTLALKTYQAFREYKNNFQEAIDAEEEFPLAAYQEEQKQNEENTGQYAKNVEVYMPSTRTKFYKFIQDTYVKEFTLTREIKDPDPKACEALMKGGPSRVEPFRYQRFIKEYIRQSSPYRGVLVYHGLGSGKTCSSIAAAEALYGIANKRVIVMTPQSLRDNFIKEISFCGFRHFSLQNHWTKVPLLEREYNKKTKVINNTPLTLYEIYGRSVLSLGAAYMERIKNAAMGQREVGDDGEYPNAWLWIIDFDKEPNFDTLEPIEKDQIKAQLNETINNRFQFINYNGISNAELKAMCCQGNALDNAVIVIDEVHNLSRLMRGKIEPFLIERVRRGRILKAEPVIPGRWEPELCKKGSKGSYSRGYMFYRLLVGARNSKIIGLSGTPIINFPEEIGVLTNILAGYIDCIEMRINTVDPAKLRQFEAIANKDPRVDFVKIDSGTGFNMARLSVFQEGYIKVEAEEPELGQTDDFLGVKQSDEPDAQLGVEAVAKRIVAAAKAKDIVIDEEKITYVSHPRLPPDHDSFQNRFVDVINEKLREDNKTVLEKRLTGVVSYYRGAKPDFLPTVTSDQIVKCEFSSFAFKKYVEQRAFEIAKEANKDVVDKADNLYAIVEAFTKTAAPSSYRFRSRACCNFTFPFKRPYPKSMREINEETVVIDDLDEDNLENDVTEEEDKARRATKKKIEDEEKAVEKEMDLEDEEGSLDEPLPEDESVAEGEQVVSTAKDYRTQKADVMVYLNREDIRNQYLKLNPPGGPENGLKKYSAKLYEMLTRMETNPGPSLVYSAFEELEGLGVLGAALKANGYDEIKFTGKWFGAEPELTEESKRSLRKGPAFTRRYVAFTGKVDRRQRRAILGMFNNQWRDVPKGLQEFLTTECKFKMDRKYLYGQVFRCIGITGAGAEGISLRNVRQVHIMEPFWNLVRLEQVKGRAIRICSHMDLPMEERKVDIYTYIASFSKEQLDIRDPKEGGGIPESIKIADAVENPATRVVTIMTSDEKIQNIAERKEKIAKEILQVMKEVAVDCTLNGPDNETFECLKVEEGSNPYLFDPDLNQDIIGTGSEFEVKKKAVASAAPPPKQVEEIGEELTISAKGKQRNILLGEPDVRTGIAKIYDSLDTLRTKPIGTAIRTAKAGSTVSWGGIKFF